MKYARYYRIHLVVLTEKCLQKIPNMSFNIHKIFAQIQKPTKY